MDRLPATSFPLTVPLIKLRKGTAEKRASFGQDLTSGERGSHFAEKEVRVVKIMDKKKNKERSV